MSVIRDFRNISVGDDVTIYNYEFIGGSFKLVDPSIATVTLFYDNGDAGIYAKLRLISGQKATRPATDITKLAKITTDEKKRQIKNTFKDCPNTAYWLFIMNFIKQTGEDWRKEINYLSFISAMEEW